MTQKLLGISKFAFNLFGSNHCLNSRLGIALKQNVPYKIKKSLSSKFSKQKQITTHISNLKAACKKKQTFNEV